MLERILLGGSCLTYKELGDGEGILNGGNPMQPRSRAGSLAGGQLLLPSESRQSWAVWTVESNASIDSEIGTASLDSPLVLSWGPATHGNS